MPGSPVAVRAGTSLLVQRLPSRVRQHSALSAVSWRFDLCVAANTQQLWRQNFCSRGTSPVELSSSPAAWSRHHLQTVPMTAEGTPFLGSMNTALWLLICSTIEEHSLIYLLTYKDDRLFDDVPGRQHLHARNVDSEAFKSEISFAKILTMTS